MSVFSLLMFFFFLFYKMEEVLSYSLSYGDELWHVVLYQWLIDNALTDRLLEVTSIEHLVNKPKFSI